MPNEDELQHRIIEIVADVLGLDSEEVSAEQNFFHDLGGESIDVLDLQFRVEKELGIRMQFQEMFSVNRWALDDQGKFTAETRARLGDEFPFLTEELGTEQLQTPYDLLTVRLIAQFVELARTESPAGNG